MAIITTGNSFGTTDAVTATKLNNIANAATFVSGAVDGTSLELKGDGKLGIKDAGVTAAKLATNAVTTPAILDANVTFAKLTDVIDSDTMTGASATTLATSESIKAYVDEGFTPSTYNGGESVTLPNGLIMKMGSTSSKTVSYGAAFPTAAVSVTICHQNPFNDNIGNASFVTSSSASGFTISSGRSVSGTGNWFWQAIGY